MHVWCRAQNCSKTSEASFLIKNVFMLLDFTCSAHCEVGCYLTGPGMCDRCDFGYGMTANGSCDGMLWFSTSLRSELLPIIINDDTSKLQVYCNFITINIIALGLVLFYIILYHSDFRTLNVAYSHFCK